jgi:signal peptidase I
MEINYNSAIIGTILFLVVFFLFYLYKNENKYIVYILSYLYKPERAKLERDSRFEDWALLILLLVLIIIMGVKLVTFTVVISDSMRPEFQRGDMVLMQGFFKDPQVGDIITFNTEESQYAITHRVYNIGEIITTKGDNIPYPDRYKTTQEKILYKAITFGDHPIVIPKLGALFITDYSKQGVIYKYGDQFTFMQQLSATIRAWGYVITIIAILAYIMSMKR